MALSRHKYGWIYSFIAVLIFAPCDIMADETEFRLSSPAFENGQVIPKKHTCDGKNISPRLDWDGKPRGTQSFALLVEDPDAPHKPWIHWVLYQLPPTIDMIPEGVPPIATLANAERQGMNDYNKLGYKGPCPPSGSHRYYFYLYALDESLKLEKKPTAPQLMAAMEGHVLARAELMGTYQRNE